MEEVTKSYHYDVNLNLKLRMDEDYLALACFRLALREIVSRYDDDDSAPLTGREAARLALRALQAFPERDDSQ